MPILNKGKSKYVLCLIDNTTHCKTNGYWGIHLRKIGMTELEYVNQYEDIVHTKCEFCDKDGRFNSGNWSSFNTCASKECHRASMSKTKLERFADPEYKKGVHDKRKQFDIDNPGAKEIRTANNRLANMIPDENGLSGYEKTAIGRRKTLLEKHGNEYWANPEKSKQTKSEWTDERIAEITELSKKNNLEKYGYEFITQIPDVKEKVKNTILTKYGENYFGKIGSSAGVNSKPANKLFDAIRDAIGPEDIKYYSHTGEVSIKSKWYDFIHLTNKKIIEFNGDYWHASPKKYKADDVINYPGNHGVIAKNVWLYDELKLKIAEDAGYEVKIIWESDYRKNSAKVVKECVQWLQQ